MRRRKVEESKTGAPEWMSTYGDMVTLLLTFFVLLFSMSEIDAQKFKSIISSFQGGTGVLESGTGVQSIEYINNSSTNIEVDAEQMEVESLTKLQELMESYIKQTNMEDKILMAIETKGLIIRFKDNVLFDSGSAEVKKNAEPTLSFIADILKREEFANKSIRVEGHTDSDPIIMSKKFPTNWELSVTRASNVVRFLIEQTLIDPDRLSAAGYGQYKPISSNNTEEGKSKNRRVDVVVLREINN
ncbi:OmpA family protein [Anaerosolibacter sp.]|uniref:OmpA family protein n=1 Tax=Anaerosolibacter sp. TaxID=1872527 RepID=UPI0039EDF0AF